MLTQQLDRLRWQQVRQIRWQSWAVLLVALGAFWLYGHHRHRYVGGCDPFAYLAQSLLIRGQDPGLQGSIDPARFPAVVPLCHQLVGRNVEPIFPVGFPALLALAGLVGLEFFVTPLLGAGCILLLYAAVSQRAGRTIGLALALLWALTPTVIWGATQLMSDLPAAFFLLLCYLLWQRGRARAAGATLGLSLAVRPTNILLLPALLLPLIRAGQLRRFLLPFVAGAGLWMVYGLGKFNAPLPRGYAANLQELSAAGIFQQLGFLAGTTAAMLGPLVLLAAVAALRRPARACPELLWFGGHLLLYSLWDHRFEEWWWTRYLLPAYPALFLLAGDALQELATGARARLRRETRLALATAGMLAVCLPAGWYSWRKVPLSTQMDRSYLQDSERIAAIVPPGSLVGAMNFSGPLRLYGKLESFSWNHPGAVALIERVLQRGKAVYVVIEPWLRETAAARAIHDRFELKPVLELGTYPDYELRLEQIRAQGFNLELARPSARHRLLRGWSGPERAEGRSWVWALGRTSELMVVLPGKAAYELVLQAWPFGVPGQEQRLELRCNGQLVAAHPMAHGSASYRAQLPAQLVSSGENLLTLHHAYAASPRDLGLSGDSRSLAAAYESIRVREVRPEGRR